MNTGMWFVGLVVALGVIFVAASISHEFTNAILLLILVGIVLSAWVKIEPLANLIGKVAGGEGPSKK